MFSSGCPLYASTFDAGDHHLVLFIANTGYERGLIGDPVDQHLVFPGSIREVMTVRDGELNQVPSSPMPTSTGRPVNRHHPGAGESFRRPSGLNRRWNPRHIISGNLEAKVESGDRCFAGVAL